METNSIARRISSMLGDDGQRWTTDDGRYLDEIAAELGGTRRREPLRSDDHYRWTFYDGSAVTCHGGYWDLGYQDCWCWEGEGHTCGR